MPVRCQPLHKMFTITLQKPTSCRMYSNARPLKTAEEIASYISTPSWTTATKLSLSKRPEVTVSELHHLLRLSALPLPATAIEEEDLLAALHQQIEFIQSVCESTTDPTVKVEPLVSIRDETVASTHESEVNMSDKDIRRVLFGGEEVVVGKRGRIVTRNRTKVLKDELVVQKRKRSDWDPLARAPKSMIGLIMVNTAED